MTISELAQQHTELFNEHFIDISYTNNHFILISDIHGQYDKLLTLWSNLEETVGQQNLYDNYVIVFLGDYVDKGSHSKECIEWLIELKKKRKSNTTHFVLGNHDLAFGMFMKVWSPPKGHCFSETWRDIESTFPRIWYGNNEEHLDMHVLGRKYGHHAVKGYSSKTLASYGATDYHTLRELVPEHHKQFLREMPMALHSQDYIFVHAGLIPNKDVDEQLLQLFRKDLMSIPEPLTAKDLTCMGGHPGTHKCIASGHVEHEHVLVSDKRILMDTTGGKIGHLSALILPYKTVVTSESLN
jgi:hypothetical protein